MRIYRGYGGKPPHISALDTGESAAYSSLFILKSHQYKLNGKLSRPKSKSGYSGK